MEMQQIDMEKARQYNTAFVEKAAVAALDVIGQQVAKEKARGDLNCEVYHALLNPFATDSEEFVYIDNLLGKGSGRDPAYIDLFDQMRTKIKDGLDKQGVHSFLMVNCRFDPQFEDNFLLYALVSWGG